MPTFEALIVGAPLGFSESCSELNSLATSDAELFSVLVSQSYQSDKFSSAVAREISHSKELKSINFIIRCYKVAVPQPSFPQVAGVLDTNTSLTRDTLEKLVSALQSQGSSSVPLLCQVSILLY
jgi:hypothetical protein